MACHYNAFSTLIDNGDGTTTPVLSVTVQIYNIDGSASLGTTASDGSGNVASGALSVAIGTHVRFGWINAVAQAGYKEDTTVT